VREIALLFACAAGPAAADYPAMVRELAAGEMDWEYLLELARRHALLPLLHLRLCESCPDLVPKAIETRLREHFRLNSARNLVTSGELLAVIDSLEREGVQAMPYKGAALAVQLYGHLGARQFGDIDLLVRSQDVAVATRVLIERGYSAHFRIDESQMDRFIKLSYVRLFKRAADRSVVELHWAIAPRFFGFELDLEPFWPKLGRVEVAGKSVLAPPPELLLMMLCGHGAKDLWQRLEWVAGIAAILKGGERLNWTEVLELARKSKGTRILRVGLWLAHSLLGAPLPEEIRSDIARDQKATGLANRLSAALHSAEPHSQNTLQTILHYLAFKEGLSDKLRFCSRLALTTTPVDWETLPLPDRLVFLYAAIRPFRLLKRYVPRTIREFKPERL
jgi:hypothetical protein